MSRRGWTWLSRMLQGKSTRSCSSPITTPWSLFTKTRMYGPATSTVVQNRCVAQSLSKQGQSYTKSRWMTKPGNTMLSSYGTATFAHLKWKGLIVLFLRSLNMVCRQKLRNPSGRTHPWLWRPLGSFPLQNNKVTNWIRNLSWLPPMLVVWFVLGFCFISFCSLVYHYVLKGRKLLDFPILGSLFYVQLVSRDLFSILFWYCTRGFSVSSYQHLDLYSEYTTACIYFAVEGELWQAV